MTIIESIEITLHEGNISSREIRTGDTTIYCDTVLMCLYATDYESLEIMQAIADVLVSLYQEREDNLTRIAEIEERLFDLDNEIEKVRSEQP